MSILDYFTPVTGLVGGCLIGLSAAALLLFNGDILGASGIASSFVVAPKKTLLDPSQMWKLFFVGMFFLTSRIYVTIWPDALNDERLGNSGIPLVSSAGYLIGGFLVGIGTRLGNGCTTGHGICGMARLSIRSFVGVGSFMLAGILTASFSSESGPIFRFLIDPTLDAAVYLPTRTSVIVSSVIGSLLAMAGIISLMHHKSSPESATDNEKAELANNKRKILPSVASAFLFSVGLVVTQMTLFSKIYGFLNMKLIPQGTWDPTLLCVMGGGFLISFLSYQWVQDFNVFQNSRALACPLSQNECGKFNVPKNKIIDANLIIGEVLFGIGWGTAGWCPGPAMFLAFAGYPYLLYRWWPMFFVGAFIGEQIKTYQTRLKECRNSTADAVAPEDEIKQDDATLDVDKSDRDRNEVDVAVA